MSTAQTSNPVVIKLTDAITPVVSIGVGSAIWTVCRQLGKAPDSLSDSDLPLLKKGLLDHYSKFWEHKMSDLRVALQQV